MTSWNWQEQSPELVPGWDAFEKTAVEGVTGREHQTAYERKIGFLTEQVERHETRSATLRTPVFTFVGKYPRLAACVISRNEVKRRTRMLLPFWGPAEKSGGTVDQLWFGEVRSFPIRKPILIYSWFNEFAGNHFRDRAARQNLPADVISMMASSVKQIQDSEFLRQVFEHHRGTLDAIRPKIVFAPDAWVLTASLACAVKHLKAIEEQVRAGAELTGRILTNPGLEDVPHHALVHVLRSEAGAPHRLANREAPQVRSRERL